MVKRKVSDALAVATLKRRFGTAKDFTIKDVRAVYNVKIASPFARRLIEQKRVRRIGRNRYRLR